MISNLVPKYDCLKTVGFIATFLMLLFLMNACGVYKSRKLEYQQTGSLEPIHLPDESMSDAPLEPLYSIPVTLEQDDPFELTGSEDLLRPESMTKEEQRALVKIQKVAGNQWIILDAPTGQVWPLVQSFLLANDMGVVNAKPDEGLIETDWLVFKTDNSTYHRFRLKIEKGVRDETTEVHILQDQQSAQSSVGQKVWPVKSVDPQRERWFIDSLSNRLANDITNRAASLLGQAVGGEDKVKLTFVESEPTLRIRLDKTRAMASLSRSTSREGFVSWEERVSDGLFYVGYSDPDKKSSWWKMGMGKQKVSDQSAYSLDEVLAHLDHGATVRELFVDVNGFATGASLDGVNGYLLKLTQDGNYHYLWVRNARGQTLDADYAKHLLLTIKRNMI